MTLKLHPPLLALSLTLAALRFVACAPAADSAPEHPAFEALQRATYEPGFGLDFWFAELGRDSALWRQAESFCSKHPAATHPNCATVRVVAEVAGVPGLLRRHRSNTVGGSDDR